jgi:hypothetical protein
MFALFKKFPNPKRRTASANIKECTLFGIEQLLFSCSIRLPAGIPLPVVHGPLVVPEAALLGRPVVALVTREGDETVLRHLVHLQAVGLGRLVTVMGTVCNVRNVRRTVGRIISFRRGTEASIEYEPCWSGKGF